MTSSRGVLLTLCLYVGTAASVEAEVRYTILDLGVVQAGYLTCDINNQGQVILNGQVNGSGPTRAFRTAPNSPINWVTDDLGTLGAPGESWARGINDSGQVVGQSGRIGGYGASPFRTAPSAIINPATDDLGGSMASALDINSSGQVVGYTDSPTPRAFRTTATGKIEAGSYLGHLGGGTSMAHGINDSGQAVGESTTGSGHTHAFRTSPNAAINPSADDIGTLGGTWSVATRINNSGQVTGYSNLIPDGPGHAFRTTASGLVSDADTDLGTLGGTSSTGYGINDAGTVVGASTTAGDVARHAFIYMGNGPMLDLNDLIDVSLGWTLREAAAINDHGQIVGYGLLSGQMHGFLLTPIPEPATLALLAFAACLLRRRERGRPHRLGLKV